VRLGIYPFIGRQRKLKRRSWFVIVGLLFLEGGTPL
jgi:hypothetical protein